MSRPRYDPSPDRQDLYRLAAEYAAILRVFSAPESLVRGRLQILRRRCGKKRCRCNRGQLHESSVFVNEGASRRTIRTVNYGEYHALRKPSERYRFLKRSRARLSKLHREVLRLCDRLCAYRVLEGKPLLLRVLRT